LLFRTSALIFLFFLVLLITCLEDKAAFRSQQSRSTSASVTRQPGTISTENTHFVSFDEAFPILQTFSAVLPDELVHVVAAADRKEWDKWVRSKDEEVRQRLQAGDFDTLANLLLFGTSYTSTVVLTPELLKNIHSASGQPDPADLGGQALLRRLDDLTSGLARPGTNERLTYFHDLLSQRLYHFETPEELFKVKQFLGANLLRMLHEDASYSQALQEAQRLQVGGFEKRSQVFAQRGISLDTSLFPNYAIEEALRDIEKRGLLTTPVAKAGVIGPGLDVVNKDEGWDFYPEQTIQPFLLMDTLAHLRLADVARLQVETFDISQVVNQHLANARARAEKGTGYTVQLPIRTDIPWTPATLVYWKRAGLMIGRAATPLKSSPNAALHYRSVTFAPRQVLRLRPIDLNVIYQRAAVPDSDKLDLIIATNMFVYYDSFQQALAMSNIASLLRKGGLLLTNDGLPNSPNLALQQVGSTGVAYSSRPNDGDEIRWFQLVNP
jgi:hypothetical protein